MIAWLIGNAVVASLAAVVVALICRFNRSRPEVCHGLWLVVFALLVMPPLPIPGLPGASLRSMVQASFAEQPEPVAAPESVVTPGVLAPVTLPDAPLLASVGAPIPTTAKPTRPLPVKPIAFGLTALLALGLSSRFARRVQRFHTKVIEAPEACQANPEVADAIAEVAARLGVGTPEVRLIQGIGSPAVWCLGRARLLWPTGPGAPTAIEPAVIAHELAHIARRDTWVARIEPFAAALLFWNPLFWLIRQRVHTYAELSCDAWALWAYPNARRAYAEALVGIGERNQTAPLAVRGLCATHPNVKDLEMRLTLIMKKQVTRGASKGLLFAAALGALIVAPGMSQDSPVWKKIGKQEASYGITHQADQKKAQSMEILKRAADEQKQGNIKVAIGMVESALQLDPSNGAAHANAGYMLVGAGQTKDAAKHFKTQIKLGFQPTTALYNLACCKSLEGDANGAASHLAAAIRTGFDDTKLMSNDADLATLHGSRSYDAAVKLTKILKGQRSELSGSSGDERFAILKSIAKIASENGTAMSDLGMEYHNRGQFKQSLDCFQRQANLGHEAGRASYNAGCALARLGHADEAIEALYRSAELQFSWPTAGDDADLTSLKGHPKFEGALKALSKRQEFATAVENMVTNGEYEQAFANLSRILDNPDSDTKSKKWAYSVSSDAYEALGDHEVAKEYYALAKELEAKAKKEKKKEWLYSNQEFESGKVVPKALTAKQLQEMIELELGAVSGEMDAELAGAVEAAMQANIKDALRVSREAAGTASELAQLENELAHAQAAFAKQLAEIEKQKVNLEKQRVLLEKEQKAMLKKKKEAARKPK